MSDQVTIWPESSTTASPQQTLGANFHQFATQNPSYQSEYSQMNMPTSGSNSTLWILIVVVIIICCCCCLFSSIIASLSAMTRKKEKK
jgi:hypothetical protein